MVITTERARRLRTNATDAERRLWSALRGRQLGGHKFRRQVPLGGFIVDFVCLERRLIVEVDGGHHSEQNEDANRADWLRSQNFRLVRFSDREVLTDGGGVVELIWAALKEPPP